MATAEKDTCLACGEAAVKNNCRLFMKSEAVFGVWKSMLISEFHVDESCLQRTVETYKFMCTSCYKSYDRFVADYDKLKASLMSVVSRVFEHQVAEAATLSTDIESEVELESTEAALTGQKRLCDTSSTESTPKRFKPPIIVHDQSQSATTTVVSCK